MKESEITLSRDLLQHIYVTMVYAQNSLKCIHLQVV